MLVVGGGIVTFVLGCLLVFLIPISLWWLILFARPDIRSEFRRKLHEGSKQGDAEL